MQNNKPRTIAQWVIPAEEFAKRFNDLRILLGFEKVNVILTEENTYTFIYSVGAINFVEKPYQFTHCMNHLDERKDSLASAILNNELGPPTFGTYQPKPTLVGCTCSSWDLFNHGCPSARGERCRNQ